MILTWMIVGAAAGWLAGMTVRGGGFGPVGDVLIGITGALVGGWLLTLTGASSGSSMFSVAATATLGAISLLAMLRMARA
jgi:uncharacterized membrane protein YeaQ/YmgE (transglycosylase-associated protein family)